jgi:phosphatidylserine/phosphatidylglycerophosphate/cardiolipin synthase-like enzyme
MRVKKTNHDLTVQCIAGSHVVLIGWSFPKDKCDGLAGFALHRTDHEEDEAYWLKAMKTFEATDPGLPRGTLHSTRHHPIQSFMWSDYSAKPGRKYTYRVIALKGPPDQLKEAAETRASVITEAPEDGLNDVHFNRGAAASQEYARRFGNVRPDDADLDDPKWEWLSRGLYEAMVAFVDAAKNGDKLRICAYEFHFLPFLRALKAAVQRGVDLKVIYDAKNKPNKNTGVVFPRDANRKAALKAGIKSKCIERAEYKSAISHNKFMVRYRGNRPVSVWTGGTNFSDGGIFGQSNVGEVAEHRDVAEKYAAYWELLATDPSGRALRPDVDALTPTPTGKPGKGTSVIFSPRGSLDVLDWYAARAKAAKGALFMTFAFGMHDVFKDVYHTSTAPLRFALMEKEVRPMKAGADRDAELAAIRDLRRMDENLFAIGSHFRSNKFDNWLAERLTGLNSHVRYVHNKFMLIDPLSSDPIIVGGSANFSQASIKKNDENMLVIRGNKRVADIYLGEFMRLYSHHAFREFANRRGGSFPKLHYLRTDDWWKDYFDGKNRSRRRAYFSGVNE